METELAVNFDRLTAEGASRSFGMHNEIIYKFKGRGGQLRVEYAGQETTWMIRGGDKVTVIGHVAHFKQP
jgi:hypothetical protein